VELLCGVPASDATKQRSRLVAIIIATSVVLPCATVILVLALRSHHKALARTTAPSNDDRTAQRTGGDTRGHVSLILWPKQPQKVRAIAPPTHSRSIALTWLSRPLVIPFDGAYWYLGSSTNAPGRDAHIEHEARLRSTFIRRTGGRSL
jgi:hypothetical protein